METWLFALVVLGVGVLLAYSVDRMRRSRRFGQPETRDSPQRRERNRWLTYWFTGRFPTSDEEREWEREVREAEAREREENQKPGAKS